MPAGNWGARPNGKGKKKKRVKKNCLTCGKDKFMMPYHHICRNCRDNNANYAPEAEGFWVDLLKGSSSSGPELLELSLFTGAGGGLLGTSLLGWRPIGYVEQDPYCQKVLAQRQADGVIPTAPLFGDIKAFISEGWARRYRGVADCITAGFPCQPFSTAGRRLGEDDPRNLWPATREVIGQVGPRLVLLENVPGLLYKKKQRIYQLDHVGPLRVACHAADVFLAPYAGRIFAELAQAFCNLWGSVRIHCLVLGAHHVWAPHHRDRLWVLAHPQPGSQPTGTE